MSYLVGSLALLLVLSLALLLVLGLALLLVLSGALLLVGGLTLLLLLAVVGGRLGHPLGGADGGLGTAVAVLRRGPGGRGRQEDLEKRWKNGRVKGNALVS